MSAVQTTTSAEILRHTAAFLSETLSRPDLRRYLSSTFLETQSKPLDFALRTLETAISTTSPSIRASSLRLVEKLLRYSTSSSPFSSFLSSLVHHLSDRPIDAFLSLLDVFEADPSFPRTEMAPFLVHFQRSETLPFDAVIDHNCGILVQYFKKLLLQNKDGDEMVVPPPLLHKTDDDDHDETKLFCPTNRRYNNPIWDISVEEFNKINTEKSLSKFPSFCLPVRVSPDEMSQTSPNNNYYYCSSSDSDDTKSKENITLRKRKEKQKQQQADPCSMEGGKQTPPKDFVCPITTHVFEDPVTLETGQTYERKAIQEWIQRGNFTCPITRHNLHSSDLPKTNYVLKRLIATWREQNPSRPSDEHTVSPKSVMSQATSNGAMTELRLAVTQLCTSEDLRDAEFAVLAIERLSKQLTMDLEMLAKPPVINAFVEILISSTDTRVLRAAVVLLTDLGSRDDSVLQTLTRVDSDVECIVRLFKNGLPEAVVLVHLLRPEAMSLMEMDLLDYLLELLMISSTTKEYDHGPKTASLLLLARILESSDVEARDVVRSIVSSRAIEGIIVSLKGERVEERIAAVSVMLRCILEDGKCRNIIAEKAEIGSLMEVFLVVDDEQRFEIVHFLSELVKLNRRNLNEEILHVLKDEGTFSTMHTLLIYLQNAAPDESPIVAGLLLQLDLLDEPRKMSIYREEAMDTLISCLKNSESPAAQISAAETVLSLQGRFSYSGKSLSRAILLKRAGLDRSYRAFMHKDQRHHNVSPDTTEDEKGGEEWERKVAYVLVSHEFGLVFEGLVEGLKSKEEEVRSVCLMTATWLVYMLSLLPDTGIRGAARVCLLNHFVSLFKSDNTIEDGALAMLGLNTFIHDPAEGWQHLSAPDIKHILKGLRNLKKSSPMAFQMLKVLSEDHDNSADIWNHKELSQEDCGMNGEVLSISWLKGKVFSGHSDGKIKVWTTEGRELRLIQELDEHAKAVTSLAVLHSSEKLYSASLDRTVRVWTVTDQGIYCEQVEEMKDLINNLVVANTMACYIPQGPGIKVHSWNGSSKLVNQNKYAKCLALVQGKLYCGCNDNSIQEIDLATGTVGNIQTGSKKLLGKASPIYAMHVNDGLLYTAGGPSLDGANVKIWSSSNYSLIGSMSSTMDVRTMAVSSELVYLGGKVGNIEVWCKKKLSRVETLQTNSTAKILCMALDTNEDMLVIGTSNGRIQTLGLG